MLALILAGHPPVKASEAGDRYVSIYGVILQGKQLLESGRRDEAAEVLDQAHRQLVEFQKAYPNWNQSVISFRLRYLKELSSDLPPVPARPAAAPAPGGADIPLFEPSEDTEILRTQLNGANDQVRRLTEENRLLVSKLREALSARPADVDPGEVRRAQERILELSKENQLLQLQLNRATAAEPAATDSEAVLANLRQENRQLKEANRQLSQATNPAPNNPETTAEAEVKQLANENRQLRAQLDQLTASPAPTDNSFAAINRQVESLAAERDSLRQLLKDSESAGQDQEVERLNQQIVLLKEALARASEFPETDTSALQLRIQALEQENEDLQSRLTKALRERDRKKSKWLPTLGGRQSKDLRLLEARIAVYEAEKEPYRADELALIRTVRPDLAPDEPAVNPEGTSAPLPAAASQLSTEARALVQTELWAEAEAKYRDILEIVPNYAPILAELAFALIKQKEFPAAETTLERAMAQDSENAYILYLSGLLRAKQERFDEAVTYLSRATMIDANNAEAHQLLGAALTELGHRSAAETSLRKAIRLRPGYADAHVNLAVVYASQNPPFTELAQYHYQQALAAGHPADSQLEQLLRRP